MSEEKMYMVKNDEGKYWDFNDLDGFWNLIGVSRPITVSEENAKNTVKRHGGQVITLIEEPKKVVLNKKQAETVEEAHTAGYPANYISDHTNAYDEELLMIAYVNGYTVEKEKKYSVKVPHAEGWHFQKYSSESKLGARNNWKPFPTKDIDFNISKELFQFTEAEIEHYGLQDCEKVECDNDEQ